ncbi:alpha/beta hydrolase [Sporosarcina sp. P26b]|uniref:alpha/beta hydrolase n=1 Tax=Sporosarcina sp. P26b TaxID=2048253 RepID=UPI000C16BE7D|nr:alpha/beta hydrolase [Sporosarcina sp. P26b]PIC95773.1 alpha/beta hydrolase [Sporosarcina sp. P26b]
MKQKKSWKFKLFIGLAIFLLIIAVGFFVFASFYYKAQSYAEDHLQSDSEVTVENEKELVFEPTSNKKNIGFIFYQGAKVEAEAYAPMAKELAKEGYTVVIPHLPLKMAIFSPDRADKVIRKHPEITTWAIGGHSLGGVTASDYALRHDKIAALVLLASYPGSHTDLSETSVDVLSIWASRDEVADAKAIKAAKASMPSDAKFLEIKGGNHAEFGDYGEQKGDGKATISNEEQMTQTTTAILELLDRLK